MAIRVEHEVHQRRKGRNFGVGILLASFIGLIFALTVVKVIQLGDARQFESFDHVARPAIIPQEGVTE
mgnify:FL=1|jgi:hypothetical protein